ncbi:MULTISPECIES: site-specific integrase [unclassified Sphingomonas]|uniref:tyrosine-type recombinase/integrase n=1 Tax=unclassified Sphingomonas TaxID=196159 RepID=UPI002269B14C|nr:MULTISPECIES: site-specific integrase [unclassified Sphingomonas]
MTATEARNLPAGRHADGKGLYLLVKPTGARTWVLRIQVDGKRQDVGLGSFDLQREIKREAASPIVIPILQRKLLTLAEAREKARILRGAAKAGLDPIAERDRDRQSIPTFKDAAVKAHAALQSGWKGRGAQTFINSLEAHAYPVLGSKRVNAITSADITEALTPIWVAKPDMARKVRQRIGTVLNFAHGKGWRATEAPGRSVTVGLVRQPKGGNYAAMLYGDVPAFMAGLVASAPTTGRRALMLLILTAARPGEIRRARWEQIDLQRAEWNRPADIMKAGVAHTATLSSHAVQLLTRLHEERKPKPADLIFPGQRGALISDMTMNKVMADGGHRFKPHGFRSAFRDWAAETMPEIPDPVAEAALAHLVADKVERAYKRTQFLEMRRKLLEAWGAFVMAAKHG